MTAAAADRTSFGCSTDSPMTFFTDALFNQALRSERLVASRVRAGADARGGSRACRGPFAAIGPADLRWRRDSRKARRARVEIACGRVRARDLLKARMLASLRGLFANLRAGARLALFARVQRQDFRVDAAQLLLVVVVSALVDNAADWVRTSPDAVLDWAALGAELASFAVLVAIAAAARVGVQRRFAGRRVADRRARVVAGRADREPGAASCRRAGRSACMASGNALLPRAGLVPRRALAQRVRRDAAGAVDDSLARSQARCCLRFRCSCRPGCCPKRRGGLEPAAPPALDATNPASEPVLALQRELQDEALGALEDHAQGETDLYFVAFAPDGAGATWRPRIERAMKVMDDHWGTQGRSLAYVNDVAMLTEAPMATVTHLREALEEIAAASNPDEDIVMLYLAGPQQRGRLVARLAAAARDSFSSPARGWPICSGRRESAGASLSSRPACRNRSSTRSPTTTRWSSQRQRAANVRPVARLATSRPRSVTRCSVRRYPVPLRCRPRSRRRAKRSRNEAPRLYCTSATRSVRSSRACAAQGAAERSAASRVNG